MAKKTNKKKKKRKEDDEEEASKVPRTALLTGTPANIQTPSMRRLHIIDTSESHFRSLLVNSFRLPFFRYCHGLCSSVY